MLLGNRPLKYQFFSLCTSNNALPLPTSPYKGEELLKREKGTGCILSPFPKKPTNYPVESLEVKILDKIGGYCFFSLRNGVRLALLHYFNSENEGQVLLFNEMLKQVQHDREKWDRLLF